MKINHGKINHGRQVVIYTDGACRGNPGPGGWGAWLIFGEHEKELYGGEKETTNNRMELRAAIEALSALTKTCEIELYTDSTYVKNGIQAWLRKWKTNNWKTANKKPVKNRDLWEALDDLSSQHRITWHWVKGHAGDPGNERADALANRGIDQPN
ncbi:ribonuclease HI [Candidatus Spongiihabitans sp.]|uniref:ribonuclease HI n=1 Tax=Candidatus Spongiihabitans sp. TaxID=3101308 RepID=UPI003C6EC9BA